MEGDQLIIMEGDQFEVVNVQAPDALPTVETVEQIADDVVAQIEQTIETEEVKTWLKIQEMIQQQTQAMAEMGLSISTLSTSLIQSQAISAENYQTLVNQITEATALLTSKMAAADLIQPQESTPQAENHVESVAEEARETVEAVPVPTVPQKRKRF